MAECQDEKAQMEVAQEQYAEANEEAQKLKVEFDKAKRAYQECVGSGNGNPGLLMANYDLHQRVQMPRHSGSANIIGRRRGKYVAQSNAHVIDDDTCTLQFWFGGDRMKSVSAQTTFRRLVNGRSIDIAEAEFDESEIDWALPVPPVATEQDHPNLKVGSHIFVGGFAQGVMWAWPRSGNILRITESLIYYEPRSIGGDSGSPVYAFHNGQLYVVGRTAWSTQLNGRTVGLAMTWRQIEKIKNREVSTDSNSEALPPGTKYPHEIPEETIKAV